MVFFLCSIISAPEKKKKTPTFENLNWNLVYFNIMYHIYICIFTSTTLETLQNYCRYNDKKGDRITAEKIIRVFKNCCTKSQNSHLWQSYVHLFFLGQQTIFCWKVWTFLTFGNDTQIALNQNSLFKSIFFNFSLRRNQI